MAIKRGIKKGINLEPQSSPSVAEKGDLQSRDSDGKLLTHDGSVQRVLVDQDSTETLQNKTINADQNTITNIEDADIKAAAAIQLSKLAALTASRALESNGSGVISPSSVTSTELAHLSGATSNIQTQLNAKLDDFASSNDNRLVRTDGVSGNAVQESPVTLDDSGNMSGVGTLGLTGPVTDQSLTANRALASNASKAIVATSVTDTELGYVSGVTSAIQTQINSKVNKAGDTMSGDLSLGGFKVTSLGTPTSATDAVNKAYVDSIAEGLHVHAPAKAATTGTLASITGGSVTYDNGVSGVGATLTLGVALNTLDSYSLQNGDRILVKDEATQAHNGIYTWATGGTVLTRAIDFDTTTEIAGGDFVFVQEGTLYANTGWVETETTATIGTDAIIFVQFSGSGTITTDGEGIELSGTQLELELDGATLSKSGTGLKVADSGITDTQVSASAAIARSKIASGNANHVVINDGLGVLSSEATLAKSRGGSGQDNSSITFPASGTLVTESAAQTLTNKTIDADQNFISNIDNADIKASANIDRTKLASGTADHVIINNGSGVISSEARLALSRGGSSIDNSQTNDNTTTGASATLNAVTGHVRLTNASLTSLAMIPAAASGGVKFSLYNDTGATISVLNDTGATAADRIITGTGASLSLASNASLNLVYDSGESRWLVIGGTGAGTSTSSSGFIKVKALDISNTTLPTGAVVIDGLTILNGERVLFTGLALNNNRIYEAVESGGNVTSWTTLALFEGASSDPVDGDTVFVQEGDYYADNILIYSAETSSFSNLLNQKASLTLVDNTTNSVFLELDTADYKFVVMEYSIERGTSIRTGIFSAASNGTTNDDNDLPLAVIGDVGVTIDSTMSGTILQIKYTTTSTGSNATLKRTLRIW